MWKYGTSKIVGIDQIPKGAIGFIYRIVDQSGKEYVGQKQFYTKRKKHFGKKKLAEITDKRVKTYEHIVKESNWLDYTGSNKELNENIKSGTTYTKQILEFCFNKKQLSYFEMKHMILRGVIEPGNNSYNGNILGKYYPKDLVND